MTEYIINQAPVAFVSFSVYLRCNPLPGFLRVYHNGTSLFGVVKGEIFRTAKTGKFGFVDFPSNDDMRGFFHVKVFKFES